MAGARGVRCLAVVEGAAIGGRVPPENIESCRSISVGIAPVRLRVGPQTIEVADLGNKWGSALPNGHVRIHWGQRPAFVDHVLVHELAHL
ncbi:M48 family metallopeptidase [Rhodococcus sp. ACPA1]|uniref:M48 family metallopeptidase n=1 Tax=Rhodococcus sp. ACPA1 TaxID=2028572 RepID=UPI00211D0F51|nr:M48 family metallopeptidase [Rhodococcus sp. ACPA1]